MKLFAPTVLAAAVLVVASVPCSAQSLVISEFMASNKDTLNDEDGDSEDWIEIFNQSANAVNLDGWYLTDETANLVKWPFPSVVLSAGSQLVVFASSKDRRDPASELHTNFKLSSGGEYLGLVRPDGTTVEHDYSPTYPIQVRDVSYGLQQGSTTSTLIAPGAAVKYKAPTTATDDVDEGSNPNSWIGTGFPDASWTSGTTGLGYATGNPDAYDSLINTDVQSIMFGGRTSIYIRIPFNVADPSSISTLTLKMKYDDGFVAYLNGVPESVAEANAEAPDQLDFESNATANHDDGDAVNYVDFPISTSVLNVGANVLCLHGLNRSATSSDVLFLPELEASSVTGTGAPSYFTAPTPGAANSGGASTPGPLIRSVTNGLAPLTGNTVVIEAEVLPTIDPISGVSLTWGVMYDPETTVAMLDNGTGGDASAGDGIFTTTITAPTLDAGEMIRWKVTATDTGAGTSRQPQFPDPLDSPEYFGTIAADSSVNSSNLPIFHWFTASPSGATTTSGSRGSVYYLGQFYDNIQADRHGQSTGGFPKKSYDFDFNKGDRFLYQADGNRVKDINMLTNWADKSKTRNTLGYEIMRNAGHPAHYAFTVRIQQNAAFFSTAAMVEDGDDRYLERVGLDGEGALYKMYNRMDSSSSGVNKKTRQDESNSDLAAVVAGLGLSGDAKLRYGYDNMNIPGLINYLAALDMTNNRDHGHKNYYIYRDTNGTQEWRPLVWDIDLCLGRNWVSGPAYFDDTFTNNNLRAGPSNRMKTLIFDDTVLNRMYLRRMRSVIDEQIGSPASPVNTLATRVDELVAIADPTNDNANTGTDDADLDYQEWGSWGNNNAMRAAADRIKNEHLPTRRAQLAGISELPSSQPVAPTINIGTIDFNPATSGASPDQDGEYFTLTNPNGFEVDMSDWVITGGVSMTLPPGAVIPRMGTLYVARDAVGFRARSVSPKADEKRYVVSGYAGQLSARGETITLTDDASNQIATTTYPGSPTAGQNFLRVSELLYAPSPPTAAELSSIPTLSASSFEFIELTNTGPSALVLSGAQFTAGVTFTFPSPTTLAPGAHILIVADQAAFELRNGAGLNVAGEYTGKLNNDGEQLQIVDPVGENILEFTYNDAWYDPTDDQGYSLQVLDPAATPVTDFDQPENWGVSQAVGGDPGSGYTGLSMSYQYWKNQNFTQAEVLDPLVTGPDVDLDGDELSTAFEYGLGGVPDMAEATALYSGSIVSDGGSDYYALIFRRRNDAVDLTYLVEMSDDLNVWSTVATMVGTPEDNADGTETVTIRDSAIAAGESRRFVRLRIIIGQ